MKRILLVLLTLIVTTVGMASVSSAQTSTVPDQTPFRFEMERTQGYRGAAVQGWVHNALPWRITNVRLQVDSIDTNGTLLASVSGWVVGDVVAGGRGYFYVPVSGEADTYRARVLGFHKVMLEAPSFQAP
jgi:hypothetical protein